MTVYVFDGTMDGLLTAVFDAFYLKELPERRVGEHGPGMELRVGEHGSGMESRVSESGSGMELRVAEHGSGIELLAEGDALPLFCDRIYKVHTDEEKARRVWTGLEKRLSREALRLISVSWLSELRELNKPLFRYICKVFLDKPSGRDGHRQGDISRNFAGPDGRDGCGLGDISRNFAGPDGRDGRRQGDISRNFADPDVLAVTNIARRVLHEQLRMKQFIRFQKAKDGTYLAVVSPDHNVLPIIIDHFQDRFNDQPWLIYDAKRHYGYYYSPLKEDGNAVPTRITFENEAAVPFDLGNGKLSDDVISCDDQLLQDLWRTYFKAICIRERMNPRKQLNDMPRRYWKYMTEKN